MKATKLKSGNWNVRVYIGEVDGKKKWKSFTAKTKSEALRKAAAVEVGSYDGLSLVEACQRYIDERGPELSPSTVRGYISTFRAYVEPDAISRVRIDSITTPMLQSWIRRMNVSQKSKKNHLGFVLTVLRYFEIDKIFRVRIAPTEPKEMYTPTAEEVNKVMAVADPELRRAIALASLGMRRGEICALTAEDIDRQQHTVRVSKAYAKAPAGGFVLKMPKTQKSVREVPITPEVLAMMPEEGPVVNCSPDVITLRFIKAVKRAGVPHFRFHDLRSFFASSSLSAVGAASRTVQDIGGWKTDRVMRKHYDRTMTDQKQKDTDAIILYFSEKLKTGP